MGEGQVNKDKSETGDHSVPTDLLDLHLELEDTGITPEIFKEAYGK